MLKRYEKEPLFLSDHPIFGNVRLLMDAATQARSNAYAPYSRYQVGCAILSQDGRTFTGVNVETANFDGTHAEENAVGAMVLAGCHLPKLVLTVAARENTEHPLVVPSCGKCLSVLWEFRSLSGNECYEVVPGRRGRLKIVELKKLLTSPFGPADVGVELDRYRR